MVLVDAAKLLGIENINELDEKQVKKMYHITAQKTHPDKGGNANDFIKVRLAYTTLRDWVIKGKPEYYTPNQGVGGTYTKTDNSGTNSTNEREYRYEPSGETEHTNYQELYEKLKKENEKLWKINTIHETQIGAIITLFNEGQSKLRSIQEAIQISLQKIDEQYEIAEAGLQRKFKKAWWEHIIPTKKLSYEEYVIAHNSLIEESKEIEAKTMQEYHTSMQRAYEEILTGIYNILS